MLAKPAAWVPIGMSLAALLLVVGYVALFGVQEPQADEGIAARIFQLLLVGQIPIVAYFAFRWVPHYPKQALQVLAFQLLVALAAFFTVFLLEM